MLNVLWWSLTVIFGCFGAIILSVRDFVETDDM